MGIPATCCTCGFSETRDGRRGSRLAEMHCRVCGKRTLARHDSKRALEFEKSNSLLGKRVRFTVEGLGTSEIDDMGHTTEVTVGPSSDIKEGTVAFLHPNPKLRPDWFYVCVAAPDPRFAGARNRILYAGMTLRMCEIVEEAK